MASRLLILGLALVSVTAQTDSILSTISNGIQKELVAVVTPFEETIASVGSSQCSNVKKIIGVAYEQVDGEEEPDLSKLTLEYRDPSIRVVFNLANAAERIVQIGKYDASRKLVIFVHGFTDDPSRSPFGNISSALLQTGESNVLALDASSLIRWLYLRSTTYVRFIGERLGETLAAMVNNGLDPASIHLIGHSLGAHISGFTSKTFTNLTGLKVGRISGLDPAGPCFSNIDPELRLKASDADFVDVVHTDDGVFGLRDPIGQVDYYPNNGVQQPNCLLQTCSHCRSWMYYTESILNPKAFPAVKCNDWDAFQTGNCSPEISYMGYASEPGTQGLYYLQTNGVEPFGLGEQGTLYENNEGIIRTLFY